MSDPQLYNKIKYLIKCYKDMGGATTEDLIELAERLANEPEFLQSELDSTTYEVQDDVK